MDKQGFKKFLQFYGRYIYSIAANRNSESCDDDEIISDSELDFLFNLYQEVEFNPRFNRGQITITK